MGLGRPRCREYRGTPLALSLPPSFLPAYLRILRSPLLQKARWEPPSLPTPRSAVELLGFLKNDFCYLEAGVAPALAELAASSGSVPRHSGARRLRPIQPGFPRWREAEGRRRVPGWAPEQGVPSGDARGATAPGTPLRLPRGGPVRPSAAAGWEQREGPARRRPADCFILFLSPLGRLCGERVKPVLLR